MAEQMYDVDLARVVTEPEKVIQELIRDLRVPALLQASTHRLNDRQTIALLALKFASLRAEEE